MDKILAKILAKNMAKYKRKVMYWLIIGALNKLKTDIKRTSRKEGEDELPDPESRAR